MKTLKEKEDLYVLAKERYYEPNPATGKVEPIMSDIEFDILEKDLERSGSKIISQVGTLKGGKIPHLSPMLSLDKVQVWDNSEMQKAINELKPFISLLRTNGATFVEFGPKFDGNAINLAYKHGTLASATKRSDKNTGFDAKGKMIHIVPSSVPISETIEIRGEVVITTDIFEKKYKYADPNNPLANERNFVGGKLAGDSVDIPMMKDLVFVAYELRIHAGGTFVYPTKKTTQEVLTEMGFNIKYPVFTEIIPIADFEKEFPRLYLKFLDYRENTCPLRLDGIVIKANEAARMKIGFADHHPEWAIAIKFPPKDGKTKMKYIDWKTGSTGEVVPTAVFEPIDLDGTTVQRAALFNLGYVIEKNAWPGADLLVAKSGDIIPQVIKVLKGSPYKTPIPTICPSCGSILVTEGIHLMCYNEDECPAQIMKKLESAVRAFGMKGIGTSTIQTLYDAGIKTIEDYFDSTKMNETFLIKSGKFVSGRSLDIILEAVEKLDSVKLSDVIYALKVPDSGEAVSIQVAKFFSGIPYDFGGLTKTSVEKLTTKGTPEYTRLMNFLIKLRDSGRAVIFEKDKSKMPKFEMTGNPPRSGNYKVKEDYIQLLEKNGYMFHKKLPECDYLLIEAEGHTSGKVTDANKLQAKGSKIQVMTYQKFIEDVLNMKDFFKNNTSATVKTTEKKTPSVQTTIPLF